MEYEMKRLRVLFLVLALWAAVGVPAVVGWQAKARAAPPSQAPLAVSIAAACYGSLACGSAVTAALVYLIWVEAVDSDLPSLMDAVDLLGDWWADGGLAVEQARVQLLNHPAFLDMTDDIALAWQEAIFGLYVHGWELESEGWGNATVMGLPTPYTGAVVAEGAGLWPAIGEEVCTGTYINWYIARKAGTYWNAKLKAFDITAPESPVLLWSANVSPNYSLSPPGPNTIQYWGMSALGDCGDYGVPLRLEFEAVNAGQSGAYWTGEDYVKVIVATTQTPSGIVMEVEETAFYYAETIPMGGSEGKRVWLPPYPDWLAGWDGTTPGARADGTTGPMVEDAPASEPDDWWENAWDGLTGRLGGIRDWVEKVWDRLGDIAGTLENVWEWAQALPQTLISALAAAVVPDVEFMRTRWENLGEELESRAPSSFLFAIYDALPNLFTGGTGCVEINMHTDSIQGWPAYTMEMCIPAEAGNVTKAVSRVTAVVLMVMYGVSVAREVMAAGKDAW
jgi:hypothetical protein